MVEKTKNYWEKRYKNGGNSGDGSYGIECNFKTDFINQIIQDLNIKTINDFGCGDGNQINQISGYTQYNGYDISQTAIKNCKIKYSNNNRMKFHESIDTFEPSDLTMSLDVLYHIIEDDLYYGYLNSLIELSTKYILIYSTNHTLNNSNKPSSHIVWREFSDFIQKKYQLKLISITPYGGKKGKNNVSFYLFEKL
jgi:hypothetical protein